MNGDSDTEEIVKFTVMAIKNGFYHLDGAEGKITMTTKRKKKIYTELGY